MSTLWKEARAYRGTKERETSEAKQQAAFFLVSGVDLATALETSGDERVAILLRLARLIERERLKGARRHWSYDLNRHIALKQAYDRLKRNAAAIKPTDACQERLTAARAVIGTLKKRRFEAPLS